MQMVKVIDWLALILLIPIVICLYPLYVILHPKLALSKLILLFGCKRYYIINIKSNIDTYTYASNRITDIIKYNSDKKSDILSHIFTAFTNGDIRFTNNSANINTIRHVYITVWESWFYPSLKYIKKVSKQLSNTELSDCVLLATIVTNKQYEIYLQPYDVVSDPNINNRSVIFNDYKFITHINSTFVTRIDNNYVISNIFDNSVGL